MLLTVRSEISAEKIDAVACNIVYGPHSFIVVLLYVPPRTDFVNYENLFDSFSPLIDNRVIILGDVNCPKYTDNSLVDNCTLVLNTFSESFELEQFNGVRISGNKLLDLVFSNSECKVTSSEYSLVSVDLHHPPIGISLLNNRREI